MTSNVRPNNDRAVLVFGESVNDSKSIMHLLIAANASLSYRVHARPRPMSLTREAKPDAVRSWADELRRTVRAFEAVNGRVAAVVVHRDADGHDPDGAVAATLAQQLTTIGGYPVVPVQAIEAWWFLFPEAVEAVRPRAWRGKLPRERRDVELINQPKGLCNRRPGVNAHRSTRSPTLQRLLLTSGRNRSHRSVRAGRTTT
jgi:hypothetical protein